MLSFDSWSRNQLDSILTARALSSTASGLVHRVQVVPSVALRLKAVRSTLLQSIYRLAVINEIESSLFMSINGALRLREGYALPDCGAADVIAIEAFAAIRHITMGSVCIPIPASIAGENASFGEQIFRQLLADRRALLAAVPTFTAPPPPDTVEPVLIARSPGDARIKLNTTLSGNDILKTACAALAAAAVYHAPLPDTHTVDLPFSVLTELDAAGLSATVKALHFTPQRPSESPVQWGVYEASLERRGMPLPLFTLRCIAFRGTKTWDDAIVDATFVPAVSSGGLRLHQGFASSLLPVLPTVDATLAELLTTPYAPTVITGHSLGGAYAQLCALLCERAKSFEVITFGAPLVWAPGRPAQRGALAPLNDDPRVESLAQRLHCIVHGDDAVPRLLGHAALAPVLEHLDNGSVASGLRVAAAFAEQYVWLGSIYRLDKLRATLRLEFVGRHAPDATVSAEAVRDFLCPFFSFNMVSHHSISDFYAPLLMRAVAAHAQVAMRA